MEANGMQEELSQLKRTRGMRIHSGARLLRWSLCILVQGNDDEELCAVNIHDETKTKEQKQRKAVRKEDKAKNERAIK